MRADRPMPEVLRLRKRVSTVMLLVGGLLCVNGAVFTQETSKGQLGQGLVAAAFLVGAGITAVLRPRTWAMQGLVLVSIALMSCLVATATPLGTTPFFFLWPLLFASYFDGKRMRLAAAGWMALTLGIGLAVNTGLDHRLDMFTGTVASVGVVTWLVSTMRDRDRTQRELLQRAAATDHLTGLLNRRAFDPQLLEVLGGASETRPASVVLFDVDHFKSLNDEWGHLIGDQALERVGEALRLESRAGDAISRFGGDEFVVALAECGPAECRDYAARVCERIAATQVVDGVRLTASSGSATATGPTADSATMLGRADAALYEAKARRPKRTVSRDAAVD